MYDGVGHEINPEIVERNFYMNNQNDELRKRANTFCEELSHHEVLQKYWSNLSLILKGSVARGNADQYSDIDFVFFSDESTYKSIINDYHIKGLTKRTDGIFIPLTDWIGHYHIETYDTLDTYFSDKNFPQIWEYTNIVLMHDPQDRFKNIINMNYANLFNNSLQYIKNKYLELQLTLDWLRHPLKRGDKVAVLLHCTKIIKSVCQISYLLDEKPYPHDKWIYAYLDTTEFGESNKGIILEYAENILSKQEVQKNMELNDYFQYERAEYIIKKISSAIKDKYGIYPWIDEWYLYV